MATVARDGRPLRLGHIQESSFAALMRDGQGKRSRSLLDRGKLEQYSSLAVCRWTSIYVTGIVGNICGRVFVVVEELLA